MNYSPNYKLLFFNDRTCRFINYFILKSATMLGVVTCCNNPTHVYDSRVFFPYWSVCFYKIWKTEISALTEGITMDQKLTFSPSLWDESILEKVSPMLYLGTVARRCSEKHKALKILQNSKEDNYDRISLRKKLYSCKFLRNLSE